MSQRFHRRETRPRSALLAARLARAGAVVALIGAGVLGGAAVASAHDELTGTDPAAGSTVDVVPGEIRLTFNEAVVDAGAGANIVQVTDPSGAQVQDGAPVVDGGVVTQALTAPAQPNGEYTVLWRVVSVDGHPVSNEFTFTVAGAPEPTEAPSPTVSASAPPPPTASATASAPSPTAAADDDEGLSTPVAWAIAAGVGVVVIAALVASLLLLRTRQLQTDQRSRTEGRTPPGDAPSTGQDEPSDR